MHFQVEVNYIYTIHTVFTSNGKIVIEYYSLQVADASFAE